MKNAKLNITVEFKVKASLLTCIKTRILGARAVDKLMQRIMKGLK